MSLTLPSMGGFPGFTVSAQTTTPPTTPPTASQASKPPSIDLGQVPMLLGGPATLAPNDPDLPVDLDEAAAPTVAEPIAATAANAPTDIYVAPMSNTKQRFWQKLLCIGCCVPDN